ncbi:MAG: T9SS type A sorting domain-containing protein [Crocinitomicaceae bacterium]
MKHLILITTFFLTLVNYAQQLTSVPFNLNPGGYITDVAYFKPTESYIIVGNFNSINGIPRANIAFLNSSLTAVQSYDPILTINDYIQTIAVYQNRIFIGGNFNSISENTSVYLGNFGSTDCLVEIKYNFSQTNFEFVNKNWNLTSGSSPFAVSGINDLEIYGDSLLISGAFFSTATPIFYNLAHYDLTSETFDPNFASPTSGSSSQVFDLLKINSNYLLAGETTPNGTAFGRTDLQGNNDLTFSPNLISANSPVPFYYYSSFHKISSTIITALRHNTYMKFGFYDLQGNIINLPSFPTVSGEISDLNCYKSKILRSQSGHNQIYGYEYNGASIITDWSYSVNSTAFSTLDHPKRDFNIAQNYLFVSSSQLSTLNGEPRQGLAIICMEPYFMTPFTTFSNEACSGKNLQFAIDSVKFASGYHWSYSGQGATINGVNIDGAGANFIGQDKNDIWIDFGSNFAPGYLTVRAFSACGELTSDSTSIYLSQANLPQFSALNDTAVTCINDTLILFGQPISPIVSEGWYDFQSQFFNQNPIEASQNGSYVYEITGVDGCKNYDTIQISIDTLTPQHSTNLNYTEITCQDSIKTLICSSTTPNTINYWHVINQQILDSIHVAQPGTYTAVSLNPLNGCADSSYVIVTQNYIPPDFKISGYGTLPSSGYLDTINCEDTILNFIALPADTNHLTYWVDSLGNNLSDSIMIHSPGAYFLYAKNQLSGCIGIKSISIHEDKIYPYFELNSVPNLNCSVDSNLLIADIFSISSIGIWSDANNTNYSNNSYVHQPGVYYFSLEDSLNGCVSADSLVITASPKIIFENDSIKICLNTDSVITPIPAYSDYLNYYWPNGSSDSSFVVNTDQSIQIDLLYWNLDSTCYGTQIFQIIPNQPPLIEYTTSLPCGNSNYGSAFIEILGENSPYFYSLDSITWENYSEIDSLSIGAHNVWVLDNLNCIFNSNFQLSENSSPPEVNFLISTINYVSDTIHIDPICFPLPDSIAWSFEGQPDILQLDPKPIISFYDTGTFKILMKNHYEDCSIERFKIIHILQMDSTIANLNNQNGIRTIQLYPNPTTSSLNIDIEFYKKQYFKIELTDQFGTLFHHQSFPELLQKQISLNLDNLQIATGYYFLRVTSEFDRKIISIMYDQ